MSTNLYIKADNIELTMYQTPTYISNMCMCNNKGIIEFKVTGIKAKRALYLYLLWVRSLSNGKYNSTKEAQDNYTLINDYIKTVTNFTKNKKLVAYLL
jgi:hypothetical protein